MRFEEVCKICYSSSSHRPLPVFTPKDPKTSKCPVGRHNWNPQVICFSEGLNFPIRPRPSIPPQTPGYKLCTNKKKCPRGLECSFAHSDAELRYWFHDRVANEPRQKPPDHVRAVNFHLCNSVSLEKYGFCSYGTNCSYPHSERELQLWNAYRDAKVKKSPDPSKLHQDPSPSATSSAAHVIRPKPKLCPTPQKYDRCKYFYMSSCMRGNECHFAHSEEELFAWNEGLQWTDNASEDLLKIPESVSNDSFGPESGGKLSRRRRTSDSEYDSESSVFNFKEGDSITKDDCLEQYKKALRENAKVTFCIVKAMTIGPPRVGKTCLRNLLLGKAPPKESSSTPVLKTAETVSMHSSSTIKSECISTSGWQVIDNESGIHSLLKYLQDGKHSTTTRSTGEDKVLQSGYSTPSQSEDDKDDLKMTQSHMKTQVQHLNTASSNEDPAHGERSFAEQLYQAISHSSEHSGVQLLDAHLLQFLDTGGQISYHDILPVFVTTPAVYLHVFNVNEPLDERPIDRIQFKGRRELKSVRSPFTTLEMISRSAVTVHSLAYKKMKVPRLVKEKYEPKPKMILVGTHVDELQLKHKNKAVVEDELNRINRKLDSALSGLKFSIVPSQNEGAHRMIHPVNNHLYSEDSDRLNVDQQQKSSIENLRKEIDSIATEMKFSIPVPWYLQQLILTRESKETPFYKYGELLELCKKNGTVKENSEFYAMITLFHDLGLLVHHDVGDEPKDSKSHNGDSTCLVFCNPSFLYENISRLYTVQFEDCHGWKLSLKSQGLLKESVLEEIKVDEHLPRKWFMDLLVTLFIGAEVAVDKTSTDARTGRTIFVPSVLLPDKLPNSSSCCNKLSFVFEIPSDIASSRKDTFIPCGVFTGTIARLLSLPEWEVASWEEVSRTSICFEVGHGIYVQLSDLTHYITIGILADEDIDIDANTCQKLRDIVFDHFQESYKYLFKEDAKFVIGLPCWEKGHQGHIAKLVTTAGGRHFYVKCVKASSKSLRELDHENELNIFLSISHPAVPALYHTPSSRNPPREKKPDVHKGENKPVSVNPPSKHAGAHNTLPKEEWKELKPSEIHLRKYICKSIGSNWTEVCTYLGIANEEMMTVMKNHPGNTNEIIFQSIMLWHRGTYLPNHPPTWSVLLKALEDAEYKELAKELREKLPSGKLED